ncbi:hypothetical protein Hanom_Chr04g00316621 [Helianthus anomalus]
MLLTDLNLIPRWSTRHWHLLVALIVSKVCLVYFHIRVLHTKLDNCPLEQVNG